LSAARRAALVVVLLAGCETTVRTPAPDGGDGDGTPSRGDGASGDGTSGGDGDADGSTDDGSEGDGDGSTGDGDGDADGSTDDGSEGDGSEGDGDDADLVWRDARLTNFTSYPEPGSEECIEYSGCEYSGYFAGLDGQQPIAWVMANNIAAVHSDDFDDYLNHTLRVRDGDSEIDVVVYDMCADSDCSGCCTRNKSEEGFLIDLESYTAERFGVWDGTVQWACIDC
jgi:hypothetical protein